MILAVLALGGTMLGATAIAGFLMLYQIRQSTDFAVFREGFVRRGYRDRVGALYVFQHIISPIARGRISTIGAAS